MVSLRFCWVSKISYGGKMNVCRWCGSRGVERMCWEVGLSSSDDFVRCFTIPFGGRRYGGS